MSINPHRSGQIPSSAKIVAMASHRVAGANFSNPIGRDEELEPDNA
jgi:hypothetical protein